MSRVNELECVISDLSAECRELRETLAAQAAVIEKLRESLRTLIALEMADTGATDSDELCCEYQDAIRSYNAIPTDSTQILEQYVKEKTQAQAAVIKSLKRAIGAWDRAETSSELQSAEAGLLKALAI